jgi:SAM-dependent methyltransferase
VTETRSAVPLVARYGTADLEAFTPDERARFAPDGIVTEDAAWQLLYRLEPELYERLIAGERIHPDVLRWLPEQVSRGLEIAAGSGRLTAHLEPRCDELVVVEPAATMRARLVDRFAQVEVRDGFFDALPVEDGWAELVLSCSAFRADERGLAEMERVTERGGLIVLVWPADVDWLLERGFGYQSFDGEMSIEFGSPQEAVELGRIFYPDAADVIAERGSAVVPYDLVGMNAPRDLAWKVM